MVSAAENRPAAEYDDNQDRITTGALNLPMTSKLSAV